LGGEFLLLGFDEFCEKIRGGGGELMQCSHCRRLGDV